VILMGTGNPIKEKFEFYGRPSLQRPDITPPTGWNLPLITSFQTVRNHTLSPDGQQIAFIWDRDGSSDVFTLSTQGGWPRRLSFDRGPVIPWDDEYPQWSADSRWIAFTQDQHVQIVDADGGVPKTISDFAKAASSPVWMSNGDGLIVSVDRYDSTQLVLTDRFGKWPRPLTDHANGDAWDAQPSPDGLFIAYVFRPYNDLNRRDIRIISVADGLIHTLAGDPGVFTKSPRWNPHRDQLAFLSQKSGFYEIWITGLNNQPPVRLSHYGCDVIDFAWSPTGNQLACIVNRSGSLELDILSIENGKTSTLFGELGCCTRPNWSKQGDFITVEYESPILPADIYRIDLQTGKPKGLTNSQIPAVAGLDLVLPQQISYSSSDGLEIPGFLYKPKQSNKAAVVYLHGGPDDQYIYFWDIFIQYLVAKGYTVLAPNYRGSTGYGVTYERLGRGDWGGGDVRDSLNAANFLATFGEVDSTRIACWGPSYGGYLTNCALARDPKYRYACGISVFGDANLLSSWALCSHRLRLYTEMNIGNPSQNRNVFLSGSPIFQVGQVRKPILLLHGLLDDIVPPEASEEWAEALRRGGKIYEYKTYANEPHGFLHRRNRLDAWSRIERFLDWYLIPENGD